MSESKLLLLKKMKRKCPNLSNFKCFHSKSLIIKFINKNKKQLQETLCHEFFVAVSCFKKIKLQSIQSLMYKILYSWNTINKSFMEATMTRIFCNKYTKVNNNFISTYHNTMSPSINKPSHCKSCIHYTSRNCTENLHDKLTNEHNFFC